MGDGSFLSPKQGAARSASRSTAAAHAVSTSKAVTGEKRLAPTFYGGLRLLGIFFPLESVGENREKKYFIDIFP